MSIDSSLYMHESDKVALQALKAIPGFTPLLKAYMKVWSEQQFRIQNMATNIRINEKQMPKYYNMLFPICEKLGIEVPELYLELNVKPNAYTSGDTKPFIVLTSGLLDMFPEELIPTILAHECGHIACHHVLYRTMGSLILNGAIGFLGIGELVTLPVQVAFYYWMRCSELSADRAAMICDGTADKVIEMCMRFAGFTGDAKTEGNMAAFMEQAVEYRNMMLDSKWNKTLEFLMFSHSDHPLNAVRAYECNEWGKSREFMQGISSFSKNVEGNSLHTRMLPMNESNGYYMVLHYQEVYDRLQELGFTNIELLRETRNNANRRPGQIISIIVDGKLGFEKGKSYREDTKIRILYYEPQEETGLSQIQKIQVPFSFSGCSGRNYEVVVKELKEAGFTNIIVKRNEDARKNWLYKEKSIANITIGGQTEFEKDSWFCANEEILIVYYSRETNEG